MFYTVVDLHFFNHQIIDYFLEIDLIAISHLKCSLLVWEMFMFAFCLRDVNLHLYAVGFYLFFSSFDLNEPQVES